VHSSVIKLIIIAICSIAILQLRAATPAGSASEINAVRAWHLAANYYHRYVSGCGGVGEVVAHGSYWSAPVRFGFAGTPRGSIRVDRHTGTVSYSAHPTVSAQSLDSCFSSVTKRSHAP